MPTVTSVFTPATLRKIREFGAAEDAAIPDVTFPATVTYEHRVQAYINANYSNHDIFSVFVAPETVEASRAKWDAAMAEMRTVFDEAHRQIADRRQREETLRGQRRQHIATLAQSLEPEPVTIEGAAVSTVMLNGVNARGEALTHILTINERYDTTGGFRGVRCWSQTFSPGQTNNYLASVQQDWNDYSSRTEAIGHFAIQMARTEAQYRTEQEEAAAALSGRPCAWQVYNG